mgnify:CR=1 FL=1
MIGWGNPFSGGRWRPRVAGGGNYRFSPQLSPPFSPPLFPSANRQPLSAKTFCHSRCSIGMRFPALLCFLLASLPLFAADEKKPEVPATKPAEKPAEPAVKKKKKGLEAPEIPAGVSLVDGVKN